MDHQDYIDIKQSFVFKGITISVEQTKWVSQPEREQEPTYTVEDLTSSTETAKLSVSNFIIEEFKKSKLHDQVINIETL